MEHSYQNIIDYAFRLAMKRCDLDIIEQCLIAGICVTSKSIKRFEKSRESNREQFENGDYYEEELADGIIKAGMIKHRKIIEKIFELLLKNRFDTITNNVGFMSRCVLWNDDYYIQSIIGLGYNGNHITSPELLLKIIEDDEYEKYCDNTRILLDNGLWQHMQLLLMRCVELGRKKYLDLFILCGANCYSVLNDLSAYVSRLERCPRRVINTINIALKNMYDIKMLHEPIFKYFLIKSISYNIPIEIAVYIIGWYMLFDYVRSDSIKENLRRLKSHQKQ